MTRGRLGGLLTAACLTLWPRPPAAAEEAAVKAEALLADPAALASWLRSRSPDLKAAAARAGQARAGLAQSRVFPNPTLGGSLGDVTVGGTNPPGLAFSDTAIYNLTLSETLEIGKRGPRVRSARFRRDAGIESYRDAWIDALGRARTALGRVVYLRGRQAALQELLEDGRRGLELQRTRLDHGDLAGIDFDRLLLETQLLEAEIARNQSAYREGLEACAAVFAATCETTGEVPGALDAAAPVPATDPNWADALPRRPDLRALHLEQQSAREEAVLAGRRAVPDPSLSIGYTRDQLTISGDQPRTLTFGISLPVPIFDRGRHDAERARLRAEELAQSEAAAVAKARADVASLIERRDTLARTLDRLRSEALPRSRRVLEATLDAVNQGELSMTDLLLARRTHTDLVLKVMELQFEAFSTRSDLRQALGLDAELAGNPEEARWTRP